MTSRRILRSVRLPLIFAVLTAAAAAFPSAAIEHGPYSLEILVDGVPLDEFAARGRTYIEATEGHEYSIRVTNHTARRIAVALSVDGLNTIDAKTTTAGEASKWILSPYQTITLDGWQTSSTTARRFFFTTEEKSYGAWLGRTTNLGVISAAVFRERIPDPPAPIVGPRSREGGKDKKEARRMESAPSAGSPAEESELSDEMAATGIGRELGHRVRRVRFESESSPAATIELRYEYHDTLVRLGVLPRPFAWDQQRLDRRERARGFEGLEFAPDPFR
jgi:hypothetical protein